MNKWIIYISATFLCLACVFGFGYHTGVKRQAARGESALSKQKADLENHCITLQTDTKELDHGLQTDLGAISGKLNDGMFPYCVVPAPSGPANAHAAGRPQPSRKNGLNAQWLRNFAAECEAYRTKVIWFQKYEGLQKP